MSDESMESSALAAYCERLAHLAAAAADPPRRGVLPVGGPLHGAHPLTAGSVSMMNIRPLASSPPLRTAARGAGGSHHRPLLDDAAADGGGRMAGVQLASAPLRRARSHYVSGAGGADSRTPSTVSTQTKDKLRSMLLKKLNEKPEGVSTSTSAARHLAATHKLAEPPLMLAPPPPVHTSSRPVRHSPYRRIERPVAVRPMQQLRGGHGAAEDFGLGSPPPQSRPRVSSEVVQPPQSADDGSAAHVHNFALSDYAVRKVNSMPDLNSVQNLLPRGRPRHGGQPKTDPDSECSLAAGLADTALGAALPTTTNNGTSGMPPGANPAPCKVPCKMFRDCPPGGVHPFLLAPSMPNVVLPTVGDAYARQLRLPASPADEWPPPDVVGDRRGDAAQFAAPLPRRPLGHVLSTPLCVASGADAWKQQQLGGAGDLSLPDSSTHLAALYSNLIDEHVHRIRIQEEERRKAAILEAAAALLAEPAVGRPDNQSAFELSGVLQRAALALSSRPAAGGRVAQPQGAATPISLLADTAQGGNLLKRQIRELILRRRSLVPEETAFELEMCQDQAGSSSSSAAHQAPDCPQETSVTAITALQPQRPGISALGVQLTGIAYDAAVCRHACTCDAFGGTHTEHLERAQRVTHVWRRLNSAADGRLLAACAVSPGRKANLDTIRLCHTNAYVTFFGVSPTACVKMEPAALPLRCFVRLPCGGIGVDSDTYFNDAGTPAAARHAVGALVDLCTKVMCGRVRNGFALIRPPGHHAERDIAMGFCYFNNVAIAARYAVSRLGASRVAIIDWDVHHGNGTQEMFDGDNNVLYVSLHRHDGGTFFPGTGAATECGVGAAKGYSVNVAFCGGPPLNDQDYLCAWRHVVEPLLDEFKPDLVLVSAGFDAASGHPAALGGYDLSPELFGYLTSRLLAHAGGKVVLSLEGGYVLDALAQCVEACVRALVVGAVKQTCRALGAASPPLTHLQPSDLLASTLDSQPRPAAVDAVLQVAGVHAPYWRCMRQLHERGAAAVQMSHEQWLRGAADAAACSSDGTVRGQPVPETGDITAAALDADTRPPNEGRDTSPDSDMRQNLPQAIVSS